MKKIYSKPIFIAETYEITSSIAACDYHVDANSPIDINLDTNLCSHGLDGHNYGANNNKKGTIRENNGPDSITLFNDGETNKACQYDWLAYKDQTGTIVNNIVMGPDKNGDYQNLGDFATALYGNEANPQLHSPGYNGQAFFS